MPGKSRFLSEEQSTTISTFKQDSFAGGLNTDRPASELSEGELAGADNVQCFPKDIMGRPGTTLFQNRRLPGTGAVHSIKFHQSTKRWLLHKGSSLYKANATMSEFWEKINIVGHNAPSVAFNIDSDSTITENRENFIISTTSGIYHVIMDDDTTDILAYQANPAAPTNPLGGVANVLQTHVYRILYTYVRMTGTVTDGRITPGAIMEQETGSVNIETADERDYGVIYTDNPISPDNPVTVYLKQTFTVDTGTEKLTLSNSYQTGDAVVLTTTNTLPSPLAISTTYYVINDGATITTCQLATTRANAFAGTAINITDTGTGTHTLETNWFNNASEHHTHIGIYMTNDLGSGIIDPETNTGFNTEFYTWVQDVVITEIVDVWSPSTFAIDIDSGVWLARRAAGGFNLKVRQWKPLPSGDIGEIAGAWFFSATNGDTFGYYSQINDSALNGASIGYYNEAHQRTKFQDGIRAFVDIGDYLVVCTSNKTYMYRLQSFNNVGTLESVFQLTTPSRIDDTIGVLDVGTIAQISEGRFIAVCSDASVRIFDTVRWGADLSLDKVKTSEIKKMQVGSVAVYWQGAYYLWYRKDSTDTHNENTLRLAVEDAAGEGWTTYGGTDWIKPPLDAGAVNFVDSNDIQRAVVVDFTSQRPYWIETFDAYTGSGLTETFIDKSDDPGICALGSTYLYDALDDNSFDTGKFAKDLTGVATITETEKAIFTDSNHASANEARIITVASIGAGDDFDISVSLTDDFDLYSTSTGNMFWGEVKLAAFASPGDDIEIGALAGDGIYLYLVVNKIDFTPTFTYTLNWKAVQGATTYTSTVTTTTAEAQFRITLVGTILTWYYNGAQVDTDTDAAWGGFGALKGSFAASDEVGTGSEDNAAAFNYFSIISDSGMPNTCIGTDGFGSDTVTGRSPSGTIKTKEIIGNRESNEKEVQEAHAYLRPSEESSGFPAAFEVDAKDYVDGSVTANETVNDVRYLGDIQFFKEAVGRRLQAEFITNSTDFRMTSLDVDFVERREKANPLTTETTNDTIYVDTEVKTDQETWQDDYSNFESSFGISWKFQISRYDYTRELTTGIRATSFKDIQAQFDDNNPSENEGFYKDIGPDGKVDSALGWSEDGPTPLTIVFSNTKLDLTRLDSFVLNFWVKNPATDATKAIEITAGTNNRFYIAFNDATTLAFSTGGSNIVTIDTVGDFAWHNFWIIRVGTTISVYQNAALKGTMTTGLLAKYGGADFTLGFDTSGTQFFDVGIKNSVSSNVQVITIAALTDYYNDVINNEGKNYLP